MIDALDIRVRGIVQGVGFRPFVYRLAKRYLVSGWVLNDREGVFIHAEAEGQLLNEFRNTVTKLGQLIVRIVAVCISNQNPAEGI